MTPACQQGHPLTGYNLIVRSNGKPRCRTCQRIWGARHNAKRRSGRSPQNRITGPAAPLYTLEDANRCHVALFAGLAVRTFREAAR